MSTELEELLNLQLLSKEQIVDYLPGRYFMFKNKKYECNACRLLPDNKKFSIITYTNPVTIAYSDIGELKMVHGVILPKLTPRRKSTKERKERIVVEYTYVLLVKMINKPAAMSWLEFAENNDMPEQSATLYQKTQSIIEKAKELEITPNEYVDSLKDNPSGRLNSQRQLKIIATIKKPISDEISQKSKNINNEERFDNTQLRNFSDIKVGSNRSTELEKHSLEYTERINDESYSTKNPAISSSERVPDSGETEQNHSDTEYTDEKFPTEDGDKNSPEPQLESPKTLDTTGKRLIPVSISELLKLTGNDKLFAAAKIFEMEESWNQRRYYLQQLFPEYPHFITQDFLISFNKPDHNYQTKQEILFRKFLFEQISIINQNKTNKSKEIFEKLKNNKSSVLPDPNAVHSTLKQKNDTFVETLRIKRDEAKLQVSHYNYLIELYERTH